MIKPLRIEIAQDEIDNLIIDNVVYAEIAEGGAMGNDGGIMIYAIRDGQFFCYETNLYSDENMYLEARAKLLKHQNAIKSDDLILGELLFEHHYGGMGNHVFINKNITLLRDGEFFLHKKGNKSYQIQCSVLGVFMSVLGSMGDYDKNK